MLLSVAELRDSTPTTTAPAPAGAAHDVEAAARMASVVIERLLPALRGADHEHVHGAGRAVVEALDVTLRAVGASDAERGAARETTLRVASIARGDSTETRPGRHLPWWLRPRPPSAR